ncbi:MAG: acyl carrier protein [Rubrivivax sp.]|nr:acyl carrier protein [Rubrivivax sp.]
MSSSDTTNTFNRLAAMLAQDPTLKHDHLAPDATLEGLGIDSLGMVEMLWNVENEFGIKLPLKTVEMHTVGDLVRYIDALAARQGARPPAAEPAAASALPAERSAASSRTT